MRHARSRKRGTTMLEMTIAAGLGAAMVGAGFSLTASSRSGGAATTKQNALASRAAEVVERLARELTVAGMRGEDANGNGRLDAGEDVDGNGRLDADWNAADGATVADLSFNSRRADFTWSGPIRWHVDAGVLLRTEKGQAVEVARSVQSFSLMRAGDEVTVRLVLRGLDAAGALQSESSDRRIYVRN